MVHVLLCAPRSLHIALFSRHVNDSLTEFAQTVITCSDIDLSKLSKVLVKICCKQCLNVVNHVTCIKRSTSVF